MGWKHFLCCSLLGIAAKLTLLKALVGLEVTLYKLYEVSTVLSTVLNSGSLGLNSSLYSLWYTPNPLCSII